MGFPLPSLIFSADLAMKNPFKINQPYSHPPLGSLAEAYPFGSRCRPTWHSRTPVPSPRPLGASAPQDERSSGWPRLHPLRPKSEAPDFSRRPQWFCSTVKRMPWWLRSPKTSHYSMAKTFETTKEWWFCWKWGNLGMEATHTKLNRNIKERVHKDAMRMPKKSVVSSYQQDNHSNRISCDFETHLASTLFRNSIFNCDHYHPRPLSTVEERRRKKGSTPQTRWFCCPKGCFLN